MMKRYNPMPPAELLHGEYEPMDLSFAGLEGFLNAKLLVAVLRKMEPPLKRACLPRRRNRSTSSTLGSMFSSPLVQNAIRPSIRSIIPRSRMDASTRSRTGRGGVNETPRFAASNAACPDRAVVIAVLVVGLFLSWRINSDLTEEFKRNGKDIAESIASNGVDRLLDRDPVTIQGMIDEPRDGIPEIAYILVTDDKGNVICHTCVPKVPDELLGLPRDPRQTGFQELTLPKQGRIIDVCSPILAGQEGYVHVGMSAPPSMKRSGAVSSRWLVSSFFSSRSAPLPRFSSCERSPSL